MTKRVIRKIQSTTEPSLEEQLWPVQVGLFVLAGFLSGIVLSLCRFDAPQWFGRPTPWLVSIASLVGISSFFVRHVPTQYVRRAVLLAIVLSLIANAIILMSMAWTQIFAVPGVQQRQVVQQKRPQEQVVIPEYILQPIQPKIESQRDVDRPEETGTAAANETEVLRQTPRAIDREVVPAANRTIDQRPTEKTHLKAQREVIQSPPRRGEAPSLLSRRPQSQPLPINQRARLVQHETTPPQRSTVVPTDTEIAKAVPTSASERPRMSSNTQESNKAIRSAKLAQRSEDRSDLARPASRPEYRERIRRPSVAPQTNLVANAEPAVSRQTDPSAIQPRNTQVDRSVTAVMEVERSVKATEPRPSMRPVLRRTEMVAERDSDSASTLRSVAERRTTIASKPTVNTLVETESVTSTTKPVERPETRPTDDIVRRSRRPSEVPRRMVPWPKESLSRTEQMAATKRAESEAAMASMLDREDVTPSPTRTTRMNDVATSTTAQVSPAVAINESATKDVTAEPARTAIEKSTQGIAGVGGSPNLDRGSNASVGQADLAAAFARRETATQSTEGAMAMSPMAPTRQRNSLAGKHAPSTSLHAQQLSVATLRGAETTEQATASAAATVEKSASTADLAETTQARGDTRVDLGPKRVVRMDEVGRAGGGGQPNLNLQTQSRLMTRSRIGGARRISLQADKAAQLAAPAVGGGRQPTVLEANPEASSVVQTDAGGARDVSRGEAGGTDLVAPSAATTAEIGVTQASRAESIEALLSDPSSGGGKRSRRLSSKSAFVAQTQKEVPTVASAENSGGQDEGENIAATGTEIASISGGSLQVPRNTDVGAFANRDSMRGEGSVADSPIAVEFSGSEEKANGDFDGVAEANRSRPRRARFLLPTTSSPEIAIASLEDQVRADSTTVSEENLVGGPNAPSEMTAPKEASARAFERDVPFGVGGAGERIVASAGVSSPRAQSQSESIRLSDARFIRKNVGGPPSTIEESAIAVDAFQERMSQRTKERSGSNETNGGVSIPPKTEEAIELGLVYLARHQQSDGRWRLRTSTRDALPDPRPRLQSDSAATGLSLLSFLGAGYHHMDDKYANNVRAGLEFLVENQAADGNLYVRGDDVSAACVALYSHGVAALALCEAFGMTQDEWLREPAQKALDFIAASQNKRLGGWRYFPGVESDTSVSGWMIMALKSGELSQLNVSRETYDNTVKWLNRSQASNDQRHLYRYNPLAPDTPAQRHGRQPTHVMTSVGLLMRMYLGWRRDNEWMQRGGEYLANNTPQMGTYGTARRDTYYWYYATQVMFHLGGDYWKRWNEQLHPLLVEEQIQTGPLAGSWNPYAPVPDRWATNAGRLYVTTLNLLSLEVYYRHLPIYVETAR